MKKSIFIIILLSFILKLSYVAYDFILAEFFSKQHGKSMSVDHVISTFKRNDSWWYEKIAVKGYPEVTHKRDLGYHDEAGFKQSEWAFFPFYPFLNKITMQFTDLDFDASGFIWAFLFSLLSFLGFYTFNTWVLTDEKQAFFNTLVFMLFPFHYYFSMLYTEAVFFTFMIFSFMAVYHKKHLALSLFLIPLILVRPNGIIILVPLFIYFLEQNHIISEKYKIKWSGLFRKKIILRMLFFSTGPMAFLGYGLYQQHMTGEFFAFSVAQAGWYKEFMFPLLAFFRNSDFMTQFNSGYTVLVMLVSLFLWKRLPLSMNVLVWISLLLPLSSGSVTSMPRYISVIFPLTMVLGGWMYKIRYKYVFLTGFFFLQLTAFYFWLMSHPFSY